MADSEVGSFAKAFQSPFTVGPKPRLTSPKPQHITLCPNIAFPISIRASCANAAQAVALVPNDIFF